jgi:hypothetical protein
MHIVDRNLFESYCFVDKEPVERAERAHERRHPNRVGTPT